MSCGGISTVYYNIVDTTEACMLLLEPHIYSTTTAVVEQSAKSVPTTFYSAEIYLIGFAA